MIGDQNYEKRGCTLGVGEVFGKRQAVERGRKRGKRESST
jgi:hypothetical protein